MDIRYWTESARGDSVQPNKTKAKAAALAESDEEAIDAFVPPPICGWQRNDQRLIFVGVPEGRFRKTGRNEKCCRAHSRFHSFRSRGQGEGCSLGRVEGRQLPSGYRVESPVQGSRGRESPGRSRAAAIAHVNGAAPLNSVYYPAHSPR